MQNNLTDKKVILSFTGVICLSLVSFVQICYSSKIIETIIRPSNFKEIITYLSYIFVFLSIIWSVFELAYLPIRKKRKVIYWKIYKHVYLITLAVLLISFVIDNKLFILLGNHIYDPYIIQSITNRGINKEIHLSISTFISMGLFIIQALVLPYAIYYLFNNIRQKKRLKKILERISFMPLVFWAIIFINFPTLAMIDKTLPLVDDLGLIKAKYVEVKKHHSSAALYNGYKKGISGDQSIAVRKKNIIFIIVESLRSDMLTARYMPEVKQLYDASSTIKSQRHYSGSHVSETGIFSLLYGLHSFNYKKFSEKQIPSLAIDILKKNGYSILGFSAVPLRDWNGSGFMIDQFDAYKEISNEEPHINDGNMVEYFKTFMSMYDRNKPFCSFIFINSTHHNYYYPPSFEYYKPVMPQNYNHFLGDDKLKADKNKIFNRYKNSVRFADYLVVEILKIALGKQMQDETIVIITGDHGEEFWDKGLLGHGYSNLYNCRTQVPLFLHLPQTKCINIAHSSHQDVFPTIINYLAGENYNQVQKYFDGYSMLDASSDQQKYELITGNHFDGKGKMCLINSHGKYWLVMGEKSTVVKIPQMFNYNDDEYNNITIDELFKKQISEIHSMLYKY